ncbi:hypothetical protein DIPPA_14450 [Diplonema papillatum]|nr:hypothetical protein DIPPA_14450 [Diplonema papillatum]
MQRDRVAVVLLAVVFGGALASSDTCALVDVELPESVQVMKCSDSVSTGTTCDLVYIDETPESVGSTPGSTGGSAPASTDGSAPGSDIDASGSDDDNSTDIASDSESSAGTAGTAHTRFGYLLGSDQPASADESGSGENAHDAMICDNITCTASATNAYWEPAAPACNREMQQLRAFFQLYLGTQLNATHFPALRAYFENIFGGDPYIVIGSLQSQQPYPDDAGRETVIRVDVLYNNKGIGNALKIPVLTTNQMMQEARSMLLNDGFASFGGFVRTGVDAFALEPVPITPAPPEKPPPELGGMGVLIVVFGMLLCAVCMVACGVYHRNVEKGAENDKHRFRSAYDAHDYDKAIRGNVFDLTGASNTTPDPPSPGNNHLHHFEPGVTSPQLLTSPTLLPPHPAGEAAFHMSPSSHAHHSRRASISSSAREGVVHPPRPRHARDRTWSIASPDAHQGSEFNSPRDTRHHSPPDGDAAFRPVSGRHTSGGSHGHAAHPHGLHAHVNPMHAANRRNSHHPSHHHQGHAQPHHGGEDDSGMNMTDGLAGLSTSMGLTSYPTSPRSPVRTEVLTF